MHVLNRSVPALTSVDESSTPALAGALLDVSPDWIVLITAEGEILYSSAAGERLLGSAGGDLVGRTLWSLVLDEDRADVERMPTRIRADEPLRMTYRMVAGDGHVVWVESAAQSNDGTAQLAVAVRDVTGWHDRQEELAHAAYHDAVTGLPNRRQIDDQLRAAISRAERHDDGLAVLFLDVDDFKAINDAHGHPAGDDLLRMLAGRLRSNMRNDDFCARYGGDEFVVICTFERVDGSGPMAHVRRLRHVLDEPYKLPDGPVIAAPVSIGVSIWRRGGTAQHLLTEADAAMYAAKHQMRG